MNVAENNMLCEHANNKQWTSESSYGRIFRKLLENTFDLSENGYRRALKLKLMKN